MEYIHGVSANTEPSSSCITLFFLLCWVLIPNHYCTEYSVLYSTSYTAGLEDIAKEFDTSETLVTLGLTLYLIGLAIGSVILAPLSEMYGRRPVSIASLFLFTVFIIPCGLCTSVSELIVLRFLGALSGSAMISSAPGSISDMVDDEHRALAFSIWSIGPLNGPGELNQIIPNLGFFNDTCLC